MTGIEKHEAEEKESELARLRAASLAHRKGLERRLLTIKAGIGSELAEISKIENELYPAVQQQNAWWGEQQAAGCNSPVMTSSGFSSLGNIFGGGFGGSLQ